MELLPINIPKNLRGKIDTVRIDRHFVSTSYINDGINDRKAEVNYHPKGMKNRMYWEKFFCGIESVREEHLTKDQCTILLLGKGYLKQYFRKGR